MDEPFQSLLDNVRNRIINEVSEQASYNAN